MRVRRTRFHHSVTQASKGLSHKPYAREYERGSHIVFAGREFAYRHRGIPASLLVHTVHTRIEGMAQMARRQPMNDERMSQIGTRIRSIRLETGLSLQELAQKARRSIGSIMQVELGRSAISTGMLRDIANGLNVRPFDLLNLDAQNDDLGYLIELMRQDPKTAILIKELLRAEDHG